MFKKKVLIYVKDPKGGTGTFIKNLSSLLSNNNYNVLLVYHNNSLSGNIIQKKIGFFIEKQNDLSIKNLFLSLLNFIFLTKVVYSFKPDYIFAIDLYANIISIILVIFFYQHAFLTTSTHSDLEKHISFGRNILLSFLVKSLIRILYPKSSIHITPSKELRMSVKKLVNNKTFKIKSIPYFIDINHIVNLSRQKKISKKTTLTTFSRLTQQKNVELLIKSVVFYNNRYNQKITLQILGDGNLKEYLQNKFKQYKYINFIGWKENPFPYLVSTQVFILISNYEGFPYSLLEAMALGKSVIASDVDFGPREIIGKNKYGMLTRNTVKCISKKISSMLDKKNLNHFKKQAINRARDFDNIEIRNAYLSLFS